MREKMTNRAEAMLMAGRGLNARVGMETSAGGRVFIFDKVLAVSG